MSLAVLNSLFSMEWRLRKDPMHFVVQILFIKNQLQEFVFSPNGSRYMDILLWNVVESIREPFQTNHARLCTHSKICTVVCHDMLNNQQDWSQTIRLRIYALKKQSDETLRFIGLVDAHIAADHIENVESTLNLNAVVISSIDLNHNTTNETMWNYFWRCIKQRL